MRKIILYLTILIFSALFLILFYKRVLNIHKKSEFDSIFISVNILTRVFVVTIILQTYFLFNNFKIKFLVLLETAIICEFMYLLPVLFEIVYFGVFKTKATISEINNFHPLSVCNIIDFSETEKYLEYPLTFLNLFELGYFILLSYILSKKLERDFYLGFKIVMSSYGVALLLWVCVVMFFTLSYS